MYGEIVLRCPPVELCRRKDFIKTTSQKFTWLLGRINQSRVGKSKIKGSILSFRVVPESRLRYNSTNVKHENILYQLTGL